MDDAEEEEESGGGNMKVLCRLPPPVGNGRSTSGVGPQSTGGPGMRAGRNESRDWRCGANKIGCIDVSKPNP